MEETGWNLNQTSTYDEMFMQHKCSQQLAAARPFYGTNGKDGNPARRDTAVSAAAAAGRYPAGFSRPDSRPAGVTLSNSRPQDATIRQQRISCHLPTEMRAAGRI
jgi:hypothetical protein